VEGTHAADLPDLVRASVDGDEAAWSELVRRFAGLVAAVIRHYRLPPGDTQDVSQLVWLRMVEHLSQLREPYALPGWLITTTRHECQRCLRAARRSVAVDPFTITQLPDPDPEDLDESLLAAERRAALRAGLDELPARHRELLMLLAAERPYSEISRLLDIPVGSIGPTRGRALQRLRSTAAVQAYLPERAGVTWTGGGRRGLLDLE
jgi:RNA polymerase sigma factor (sigma-70 family)